MPDTSYPPGTAPGKPGDRPIGEYDPARAKREMAKPIISDEMKASVRRGVAKVKGMFGGGRSVSGKR